MLTIFNLLMNQNFQNSVSKNTNKKHNKLSKILWIIYCFVSISGLLISLGILICVLIMGWKYFPWS
jgi:O-antigen/teichoic acid export membrane protein